MAEPLLPEAPDDDLSADTSRLDASLLRYGLLQGSRMNMLALDRKLQALRGSDGFLRLAAGVTRSDLAYRAAATMQLAVELALADPEVVDWVRDDPLRRQMGIDAAYYWSEDWDAAEGSAPGQSMAVAVPPAASFRDYMAQHTRLHEDASHQAAREAAAAGSTWVQQTILPATAAATGAGAAAATPAPSMEERHLASALPKLQGIANAVLRQLGPDQHPAQWRAVAHARKSHIGFAAPPPEVFDALLAGPEHSLAASIVITDEVTAIAWRYRPDGSLRVAADAQPADKAAVERIDAARHLLAQHLAAGAATPTFTLLADHLGVLPTTPAWPDVERSLITVRLRLEMQAQADAKPAYPATPEEPTRPATDSLSGAADQMVKDFDVLLSRHAATVVRVLACARFFVGVADWPADSRRTLTLRHGLEWLREALRLPESDTERIEAKLKTLEDELRRWLARQRPELVFASPWPMPAPAALAGLARLPSALELATELAEKYRDSLRWNNEMEAWEGARQRMARFCSLGRVGDAKLSELLCAATHEGPARWLRLDPRRMTLRMWNNALLAATVNREAEPWLAAVALQRLGAGNLGPAQQEQLLAALQAAGGQIGPATAFPQAPPSALPATPQEALEQVVHRLGAWRGSGRGVGSVIVVCKRHSPATNAWMKPPQLGLALIATPAELNQLVQYRPELLRALPKPLRMDVERPTDDGVQLSMTLAELDSVAHERPWFRRLGQMLAALVGLAPRSNDLQRPAGPDALLASHRGSSNR